jgi:hypothetical protein
MPYDHFIVEINQEPAGILARVDDEFQFFASVSAAFALDRRKFSNVRDAITAVAETVGASRRKECSDRPAEPCPA